MNQRIARPATILILALVLLGSCSRSRPRVNAPIAAPTLVTGAGVTALDPPTDEAPNADATFVIAPSVRGQVDEKLLRDAFARVVAQGEQDFGLRIEHGITIYVDPDSSIGLEDALGLSAKTAIHLRAGRAQRLDTLLPLLLHEYTHVLQYQLGRLRPQWWIEGQADHESGRIRDPGQAARDRRALIHDFAGDIKGGRAPALAELRGSTSWDAYIKRSGASKAYGWGNIATSFIEDGWGMAAVARVMKSADGPNSLGSFDASIQRETGLAPAEFESALRAWIVKQG